jgi:TetR/AcrR family transcriptional repressor of mexJK operon
MAERAKKKAKDPRSKRDRVVDAAAKLFVSNGFGPTGMDAIAAEADVSKATLYSYYRDKASLFADVMHRLCDEAGGGDLEALAGETPEETLAAVAMMGVPRLLDTIERGLLPQTVAEAHDFPELGRKFWETGPGKLEAFVASYLADAKRRRLLQVKDPQREAARFIGLAMGPYLLPMLLGVRGRPADAEIRRDLQDVVAAFLASLRA